MVGSERLSQLCLGGDEQWISAEFAAALRHAHDDLGVTLVRAHAILHDDNSVVHRDKAGRLQYNFDRMDSIYDQLLDIGLRPVVELSFMPAALARDPEQTVFTYRGIISPPAEWGESGVSSSPRSPLISCSSTGSTRSPNGPSRYGTSRTSWSSGPARAKSTCACTTRRSAASRASIRGCGWAARPQPQASGSSCWPHTPQKAVYLWTSSPRTPTATFRWTCERPCMTTGSTVPRSGGQSGG